jgi:hypothetical protein
MDPWNCVSGEESAAVASGSWAGFGDFTESIHSANSAPGTVTHGTASIVGPMEPRLRILSSNLGQNGTEL